MNRLAKLRISPRTSSTTTTAPSMAWKTASMMRCRMLKTCRRMWLGGLVGRLAMSRGLTKMSTMPMMMAGMRLTIMMTAGKWESFCWWSHPSSGVPLTAYNTIL